MKRMDAQMWVVVYCIDFWVGFGFFFGSGFGFFNSFCNALQVFV